MAAAAQLERVASRSVYGVTAFSSGPVDDATRHLEELGLASHFVSKSYGPLSSSPSSNQHKKVRFSWAVDLDATGTA